MELEGLGDLLNSQKPIYLQFTVNTRRIVAAHVTHDPEGESQICYWLYWRDGRAVKFDDLTQEETMDFYLAFLKKRRPFCLLDHYAWFSIITDLPKLSAVHEFERMGAMSRRRWVFFENGRRIQRFEDLSLPSRIRVVFDQCHANTPGAGELVPDEYFKRVQRDNAGNLIGYKVLVEKNGKLMSPVTEVVWDGYRLEAEYLPTKNNSDGIYCTKVPESPLLEDYAWRGDIYALVLSGTVIETDYGYRAQRADVLGKIEWPREGNGLHRAFASLQSG